MASSWTLRNGKHNSFPYVQLKRPLLSVPEDPDWHSAFADEWRKISLGERRQRLVTMSNDYPVEPNDWSAWPSVGLKNSLHERHKIFTNSSKDIFVVAAVITRFLMACANTVAFIQDLCRWLFESIHDGDIELVDIACLALIGKKSKQGRPDSLLGASLYFDVARGEYSRDVVSADHVGLVSAALQAAGNHAVDVERHCAYIGTTTSLHKGNFPQPTLPLLGQVYLFAKNEEIKAAHRYGRAADQALPVSAELMQRLAGALDEATAEHRRGQTWSGIPSERPKQTDLLLAFVDNALEAPLAEIFIDDGERADDGEGIDGRGDFLKRTERVIDAVKAKVGADFRMTPVTLTVLRKVEPGNAKAILHRAFSIGDLYEAGKGWAVAQKNTPSWLQMPIVSKGKVVARRGAPAIAPLQISKLTRATFIREGREAAKREPVGVTVSEALELFLNESGAARVARSSLRCLLDRQGRAISGAAHAVRQDATRERLHHALNYDRDAALRGLAGIGILLAKLGRHKEDYMSDVAFKLGQLLAVADAVHAGYCADVRKGEVPPSLLGNAVLATAQADPVRALAVLSRRWAPYAAWAKRPTVRDAAFRLTRQDASKDEKKRGWPMRTAISQLNDAEALCRDLHGRLPRHADDVFRAELLLGFVAGPPRKSERETVAAPAEELRG